MARKNRIKETAAGAAFYHVMSRANNRQFLFESAKVKDALVAALLRAAAFSGVEVEAYAVMDNHFHAVVKVTRTAADLALSGPVPVGDAPSEGPVPAAEASQMGPVPGTEPIPEAELLRRIEVLKGAKAREEVEREWKELREEGDDKRLEQEQNRLRVRMNDVSEFVKTFKETFDRFFKEEHEYCGSIWSGRFTSTLVEDGEYLSRCRKYVYFNPVRAGIVSRASKYRWVYDRDMGEVGGAAGPVPNGRLAPSAQDEGSVPEAWLMRRVVQIGAGKVFGSEAFVKRMAFGLGHLFAAKHVVARPVGEIGFATHGWKLAKKQEEQERLAKAGAAKTVAA